LIVQDAFNTTFMPTTVGSFALKDTRSTKNAALVDAVMQDVYQDVPDLTVT
jgi:Asp-tRNA(Asn)/Glu-tRNA(Gln) amidotransferase A subunit family amidase